jgi:hypothetical protein
LVYGIFVLETLQAILVAHDAFASFVLGFGDFKALTDMHFAWFTMPVLSGIGMIPMLNSQQIQFHIPLVAFFVQLFYGFRIITLSKSRVVGAFISLVRSHPFLTIYLYAHRFNSWPSCHWLGL